MGASFILAPSLLSADFSRLAEELHFIEANGGQWVHLDVMDGVFVPLCVVYGVRAPFLLMCI